MKNIHLIPTDKPSRLMIDTIENKLYLQPILHEKTINVLPQHIYITSDEEIKIDEYYLGNDNHIYCLVTTVNSNGKKIILTTDPDLIADGIQSIDDEFLEWFVKNPSCEFVEVADIWKMGIPSTHDSYQLIIPQEEPKYSEDEFEMQSRIINKVWDEEEPKQETLEEAAKKRYIEGVYVINGIDICNASKECFIEGAKWQSERMYSEEEVRELLTERCKHFGTSLSPFDKLLLKQDLEWFEQFKKK
jgi:disulfide oxidoreductase YuzD